MSGGKIISIGDLYKAQLPENSIEAEFEYKNCKDSIYHCLKVISISELSALKFLFCYLATVIGFVLFFENFHVLRFILFVTPAFMVVVIREFFVSRRALSDLSEYLNRVTTLEKAFPGRGDQLQGNPIISEAKIYKKFILFFFAAYLIFSGCMISSMFFLMKEYNVVLAVSISSFLVFCSLLLFMVGYNRSKMFVRRKLL